MKLLKSTVLVKMKQILVLLMLVISVIDSKSAAKPPDIRKKMVKLMRSCFADQLKTVITTPDFADILYESSRDSEPIPIILIDENFKPNDERHVFEHLPTLVFIPLSTESFGKMLQSVKSSQWWRIDILVFIAGNMGAGCEPAAKYLNQTWQLNMLSSWFLCYEHDKGLMLYTYNPYTNRAPYPWEEIKMLDRQDDRWTLYAQRYHEDQEICTSIKFDKRKNLDGYKFRAVQEAKPGTEWEPDRDYDIDTLIDKHPYIVMARYVQSIAAAMNVTAVVNYDYPGYYDGGIAKGFLQKLINGTYDISFAPRFLTDNISSIYPFFKLIPCILTQQRNFLSPMEKILAFYKAEIRYLTGIVLLITFIFILVVYKKREFAFAAFDVLRLLLSTGVLVPFNRTATRIFFFGIFQLIIILNATFQGNIISFLTKPERVYVDTVEDLQKYHYNVCMPFTYRSYFNSEEMPLETVNYVPMVNCAEYVVRDPTVACIEDHQLMLESAFKENLHLSKYGLADRYIVFWCREDWPMKEIIDRCIERFVEAGLADYWYEYYVNAQTDKLWSREAEETAARYRPLELADVVFAFEFLAVGLGLSSLVFIVEILPFVKLWICLKLRFRR